MPKFYNSRIVPVRFGCCDLLPYWCVADQVPLRIEFLCGIVGVFGTFCVPRIRNIPPKRDTVRVDGAVLAFFGNGMFSQRGEIILRTDMSHLC